MLMVLQLPGRISIKANTHVSKPASIAAMLKNFSVETRFVIKVSSFLHLFVIKMQARPLTP